MWGITSHHCTLSTTTTSTTSWYSCHHFDTIPEARPVTSSWDWTYHSCHLIVSHHRLTPLRSLPIETSHWVLPATRLVHFSDHTSHSIHTYIIVAYIGIISCVTKLSSHTHLLSWFVKHCMRKELKHQRANQPFKQRGKISKELLRKNHSIIQH